MVMKRMKLRELQYVENEGAIAVLFSELILQVLRDAEESGISLTPNDLAPVVRRLALRGFENEALEVRWKRISRSKFVGNTTKSSLVQNKCQLSQLKFTNSKRQERKKVSFVRELIQMGCDFFSELKFVSDDVCFS